MNKLKTADIINEIAKLDLRKIYEYPSGNTKFKVLEIIKPEGPIKFLRWSKFKTENEGSAGRISINQLATVASVFSAKPNYPIHLDRLFSAGGNSRSALEALLAYTPHFYICYLQRTQYYTGNSTMQKHLMWCPDKKHKLGEITETRYEQEISEIEIDVNFGTIRLTDEKLDEEFESIEAKKTHTQIQVALVEIGNALNFKTWIAKNDRHIHIGDTQLGKMKGVIKSLEDAPILYKSESKSAASLIDCIWFSENFNHIPAVIEVEHSTGVTSGLTRMLKFKKTIPSVDMNFTIVAPDNLRNKVVAEANNTAFRELNCRYMSYSTVRFLYGLIQKFSLSNVVERNFIEPFMENIVGE